MDSEKYSDGYPQKNDQKAHRDQGSGRLAGLFFNKIERYPDMNGSQFDILKGDRWRKIENIPAERGLVGVMGNLILRPDLVGLLDAGKDRPDLVMVGMGFNYVSSIRDNGIKDPFNRGGFFDEGIEPEHVVAEKGDPRIVGKIFQTDFSGPHRLEIQHVSLPG